jgi:hypothetical protein
MWTSDHNGEISWAAHGYEPTRQAAMAAFAKSGRRAPEDAFLGATEPLEFTSEFA